MHLPIELLQHAAVPAAEALVSGLWQGIALAVVTGLILPLLPGTTASARFAVWTAVFCASAAMPLAHLFSANSAPAAATSGNLLLDLRWSYLLAGLWIGAAILRLIKLTVEAVSLRKLWREAQPLSPQLIESASLQYDLVSHKIQVCSTPDVDRPSVIGFFAPKILIPDWLCAELSATELRHIVLHEMEHLRRRDDWLNLLQKVGLVLFPLNPAMFWIDRRLSTEREIACDDGVLARTHTPRSYAASLTSVAERRLTLNARRRMVALALGAFGAGKLFARRSEFAQRIESILSSRVGQRTAGRPAIVAVLVAAIFVGSAAIAHTPELVSFRAGTSQSASVAPAPMDSAPLNSVPMDTVAKLATRRQPSVPRFENATFRLPASESRPAHSLAQPAATFQNVEGKPVSAIPVKAAVDTPVQPLAPRRARQSRHAKPQWLLLSDWEQPARSPSLQDNRASNLANKVQDGDVVVPVSRVVVRMPDGRFFLAPYAAVPTQAGWLIVQL